MTDVDCGDQFPVLSNAVVRPADELGRMRIEVQLDYTDHITIAIDTKLVINIPKPRFAVLPVSLSLAITRFSARVSIELFSTESGSVLPTESGVEAPVRPPPNEAAFAPRSRHHLHFSLHPDFQLEASVGSLLGSRAKLQDIPKIEQLLIGRLRTYIHDRFAWPRYWSLSLPNLVPSPTSSGEFMRPPPQPQAPASVQTSTCHENPTQPPAQVPDNEMTLAPGVDPVYLSPEGEEQLRLAWAQQAAMYPPAAYGAYTSTPHQYFARPGRGLLDRPWLASASSVGSPGLHPIDLWRAQASGVPSEARARRRSPVRQQG